MSEQEMMNRKEFFEWLSTCPSKKMFFINDDWGNTTIRFEYEEVESAEEVTDG